MFRHLLIPLLIVVPAISSIGQDNSQLRRDLAELDDLSDTEVIEKAQSLESRILADLDFGAELERSKHRRHSLQKLRENRERQCSVEMKRRQELMTWLRLQKSRIDKEPNGEKRFRLFVAELLPNLKSREARIQKLRSHVQQIDRQLSSLAIKEREISDRMAAADLNPREKTEITDGAIPPWGKGTESHRTNRNLKLSREDESFIDRILKELSVQLPKGEGN